MISKKKIEKRYNDLIEDVKTNDFYKTDISNNINCYVCEKCGHITKTKDVDAGVTPFIFTCEKCGGDAISTFYKDIAPEQIPTVEWYRPTLKQVLAMTKKPGLLDHVLNGGLDYRKIK